MHFSRSYGSSKSGVFPKHREIPLYKKCTLFSTSIYSKSTSYLQFSLFWAEIWYIASLLGVKKKWCGNFSILSFLPFYGAPKMQKVRFWLKMAIFGLFDPVKRRKTQKLKIPASLFFQLPQRCYIPNFSQIWSCVQIWCSHSSKIKNQNLSDFRQK